MLEVRDVVAAYGSILALKGISLAVGSGEIVGLLGRNGAGKTTLLRVISGSLRPRSGAVVVQGQVVSGLHPHEVARRGIAHVPEGRKIFPELTVRENLEIGAYLRWSDRQARMDGVLEVFPALRGRLGQLGGTLSGGEQQMLAIGRGLMGGAKFLLLDEPSLGLAPVVIESLFEAIQRIHQSGVAILLVEQNAVLALELAQRAYVIQNGVLAAEGRAADLQDTDVIRAAYLGLKAATTEQ